VGSILTFNEFLSTTLNPEAAFDAIKMYDDDANKTTVLFLIHNYKDKPYIYLDWKPVLNETMAGLKYEPEGIHFDEYEALLPRGCKFKIIKKYKTQEYNEYIGKTNIEKKQLIKINTMYNNIANISNDFFYRNEVKSILSTPFEILVIELEYISNKPIKIIPFTVNKPITSSIFINFNQFIKNTTRKSTTKVSKSLKSGKASKTKKQTKS
jgi:hypothetical protein